MVDEPIGSRVGWVKRNRSASSLAQDDIGEFAEPKMTIE
jgi:hypothetical protein